jgi:hypothetical protein
MASVWVLGLFAVGSTPSFLLHLQTLWLLETVSPGSCSHWPTAELHWWQHWWEVGRQIAGRGQDNSPCPCFIQQPLLYLLHTYGAPWDTPNLIPLLSGALITLEFSYIAKTVVAPAGLWDFMHQFALAMKQMTPKCNDLKSPFVIAHNS